jgi:glycosyltransferase involved in cell wall biosynthesis
MTRKMLSDPEIVLSILIATLESRHTPFQRISKKLASQIDALGLSEAIELLHRCDNGEQAIGTKRNDLISAARGRFVAFVDDDDDISDDYLSRIHEVIVRRPDIDCIGIRGIITFRGRHPRDFFHSLRYRDYFSRGHAYFRPPYHLNPVRRSIALKYPFRAVNYSEDVEWALRVQRAGALGSEEFIDTPLYYYKSRRWWCYQLLLDWSEFARHALGLRLVNRPALR